MVHDGFNCYFSFWAIFCPFTPLTALKMKISKNGKIGYQKLLLHDAWFLRYIYGARQTDGQTEKVTHKGRCPT